MKQEKEQIHHNKQQKEQDGNDNDCNNDDHDHHVKESTIRKMTRLAEEYKAINLSQGYPNEGPSLSVREALCHAVMTGQTDPTLPLPRSSPQQQDNVESQRDVTNQYSAPMGRLDLRNQMCRYYQHFYGNNWFDENQVTMTCGATQAIATALRTLGRPGDGVVFFQPFHELYPNQCHLFYLKPICITLYEQQPSATGSSRWTYHAQELHRALALESTRILILNSPHNPTGKVFDHTELEQIVTWCCQYNVYIITDEIYEHMRYSSSLSKEIEHDDDKNKDSDQTQESNDPPTHVCLPLAFPVCQDRVFVCNSISKAASATGWRLGWCIHPAQWTSRYRALHDQMVIMAPHPVQVAANVFLQQLQQQQDNEAWNCRLAQRYKRRLERLCTTLAKVGFGMPKITTAANRHDVDDEASTVCPIPQGAYYIFCRYTQVKALQNMATDWDASLYLLQHVGVASVPGDNFYIQQQHENKEASRYLRFAACRSDRDVEEACRRLEDTLGGC